MDPVSSTTNANISLKRELGRWDLTAIGVNQVIGGAVFALPAALAANAGAWSPWMIAAVGVASMFIALSFAEVASRFEGTGGPYLYTRAAFGRFAGFEVGWMMWFTRVASWASVINVLVSSLGFYWPSLTAGAGRLLLIAGIIAALAVVNIRGIRQSSLLVNLLTLGKLVPLVVFVTAGLFCIDWPRLRPGAAPTVAQFSSSGLLLIFAFGGYEVVPVPAGETRDPRRDVPAALVMTIALVTLLFTLAQMVTLGTVADLPSSRTPLADAAAVCIGAAGAAMITIGAVFSTLGNNMGQALSGSRNLFALAEQGDLPAVFGRVHPRFRTPVNAIVTTAAISLLLAVSGSFQSMAQASAISRLLVYVATCASTLRLRSARFDGVIPTAKFKVAGGPAVPVAAIAVALSILAGATAVQLRNGTVALAAGALLYIAAASRRRGGAVGAP